MNVALRLRAPQISLSLDKLGISWARRAHKPALGSPQLGMSHSAGNQPAAKDPGFVASTLHAGPCDSTQVSILSNPYSYFSYL